MEDGQLVMEDGHRVVDVGYRISEVGKLAIEDRYFVMDHNGGQLRSHYGRDLVMDGGPLLWKTGLS